MSLEIERIERGWCGHHICADRCTFRRNTLLVCPATGVVIVASTVGRMFIDKKIDTVGCDRYYETMAFHADKDESGYWDADVQRRAEFDSKWCISEFSVMSDAEANIMHENVCKELSDKMAEGDFLESLEEEDDDDD